MTNFIRYISAIHLNNLNIAVYKKGNGYSLVVENVTTDKPLGWKYFTSIANVNKWYSDIKGNEAGKLLNAINEIRSE